MRQTELTVLLHAKGDALYADALVLYKDYADEAALTAGPVAWCSSGYRFVQGEVMQVDHQWDDKHPRITYERGKLGRKKLVQEPFKAGSISWYNHSPYSILISLNDRQLELITLHSQLKLKKPVKVVDVTTQAVTQEELPKVFKVLDTEPETAAIILKGHGIVAISSSAVKAGQIAELIEETAMIAWEQKKLRK